MMSDQQIIEGCAKHDRKAQQVLYDDHLLKPSSSFYGNDATVPVKFNLYGGVQLLKKTRLRQKLQEVLSVAMNFQKQGKFYQSDIGLYYYKDPLIFGLWYRGIP